MRHVLIADALGVHCRCGWTPPRWPGRVRGWMAGAAENYQGHIEAAFKEHRGW